MSQISNPNKKEFLSQKVITHPRLSNGAFRLYVFLIHSPSEWEITGKGIQDELLIRDPKTIAKYFNELIDCGLVDREYMRESNGQLTGHMKYEVK